jgi:hypothetical protein
MTYSLGFSHSDLWHAIGRAFDRSEAGEVFPKTYRRREHDVIARALRDHGHLLDHETRARVEADLIRKAPRRG